MLYEQWGSSLMSIISLFHSLFCCTWTLPFTCSGGKYFNFLSCFSVHCPLFVRVYLDFYSLKCVLGTWGGFFALLLMPLFLIIFHKCPRYGLHYSFWKPITLRIFWTECCLFKVVGFCEILKLFWCVLATSFSILNLENVASSFIISVLQKFRSWCTSQYFDVHSAKI